MSNYQKSDKTLQETATDINQLSHLAYLDCTVDVHDNLKLQYFVEDVKDPDNFQNDRYQRSKILVGLCYKI